MHCTAWLRQVAGTCVEAGSVVGRAAGVTLVADASLVPQAVAEAVVVSDQPPAYAGVVVATPASVVSRGDVELVQPQMARLAAPLATKEETPTKEDMPTSSGTAGGARCGGSDGGGGGSDSGSAPHVSSSPATVAGGRDGARTVIVQV